MSRLCWSEVEHGTLHPVSNDRARAEAEAIPQGMIEWLLAHGADLNRSSSRSVTPVSYAMMNAPPSLVECLFKNGTDPHRGYLLHYAILRKDNVLEIVKLTVEKGVSINKKSDLGILPFTRTPLQIAAGTGNQAIVEYLLDQGAEKLVHCLRGHPRQYRQYPRFGSHSQQCLERETPGEQIASGASAQSLRLTCFSGVVYTISSDPCPSQSARRYPHVSKYNPRDFNPTTLPHGPCSQPRKAPEHGIPFTPCTYIESGNLNNRRSTSFP